MLRGRQLTSRRLIVGLARDRPKVIERGSSLTVQIIFSATIRLTQRTRIFRDRMLPGLLRECRCALPPYRLRAALSTCASSTTLSASSLSITWWCAYHAQIPTSTSFTNLVSGSSPVTAKSTRPCSPMSLEKPSDPRVIIGPLPSM
ncbi:hypothetical protein BDN70DRAFT_89290 [Pholiota conissans]|uniref:Uncharacterized protein n=1 Tax=Pholiota conissans TaxID=109636 RepID=A0A9P6CZ01_9AGAR|nr:hypothetical protein BDN70DRAFT_89290 [Pholiota conissans]